MGPELIPSLTMVLQGSSAVTCVEHPAHHDKYSEQIGLRHYFMLYLFLVKSLCIPVIISRGVGLLCHEKSCVL